MVDGVVSIPLPGVTCEGGNGPSESLCPFLVGPENRLIEVVVRAVLEASPDPSPRYNPLLIHGPSGTGKTHLAQGLAAVLRARHGQRAVASTTGIDFARELTDAIESQATEEFRRRYRQARLLVIEDVTRLADKDAAQMELLCTVDAVLAAGGRVIATAPTDAGHWPGMLPGLQSRLAAGLAAPLFPPGREARFAILQQIGRQRGVSVSESVTQVLAEGLNATAAELIGVLAELQMSANLHGGVINVEMAGALVAERQTTRRVDVADIATATARSFSLRVSQLRSRCRRREVVTARGVAMYLARQLTDKTLEQIGEFFGGRDHTTVLHGCRKTEALMRTEPAIQEAVERVHHGLQIA